MQFRFPKIAEKTLLGQIREIKSFLFQLVGELNIYLSQEKIENSVNSEKPKLKKEVNWKPFDLFTDVKTNNSAVGRTILKNAYCVENDNHVCVSFSCAGTYSGNRLRVNSVPLPIVLRPKRWVYAICPANANQIACVSVNNDGIIYIEWVHSIKAPSVTDVEFVYVDGYIDYWI